MKFKALLFLLFCCYLSAEKITVVTMAIGDSYQKLVIEGIRNKREYCETQGYELLFLEKSLDPSRPIPWSKVLFLLQAMEENGAYWFFWSDADSLIMNFHTRLESFLDEDYDLIFGTDFNGLNSGQFFIRNSEWSRNFLNKVYSRVDCIYDPWWEQRGIMNEFAENPEEYSGKVKLLPQRALNSYPHEVFGRNPDITYKPKDFIIHFASIRGHELSEFMRKYSKNAIKILKLEQQKD